MSEREPLRSPGKLSEVDRATAGEADTTRPHIPVLPPGPPTDGQTATTSPHRAELPEAEDLVGTAPHDRSPAGPTSRGPHPGDDTAATHPSTPGPLPRRGASVGSSGSRDNRKSSADTPYRGGLVTSRSAASGRGGGWRALPTRGRAIPDKSGTPGSGNVPSGDIVSAWPPPWRPRALVDKNPSSRLMPDQWRINTSASDCHRV